jgi:hypothetical protein
MRQIPLYRRKEVAGHALVDDADYEALAAHRWTLLQSKYTNYAVRSEHIAGTANASRMFYMHRVVLGLPQEGARKIQCDHINRNGLDNRRANLRTVTHAENQHNRRKFKNNKSGIVGVTFTKGRPGSDGSWLAGLYRDGAYIHRSTHKTKEAAGEAYAQALALYESKREQVSA